MKNSYSASFGVLQCVLWPLMSVSNFRHTSHPRVDVGNVASHFAFDMPVTLLVVLAVCWVFFGRTWNWQVASNQERTFFLRREQMPKIKLWFTMLAFMLVVSTVLLIFLYGFDTLDKKQSVSLSASLCGDWISYFFASIAAFLWVKLCDRGLRASRNLIA